MSNKTLINNKFLSRKPLHTSDRGMTTRQGVGASEGRRVEVQALQTPLSLIEKREN
jgi:hypothetical protein